MTTKCFGCSSENESTQKFCGACGSPLLLADYISKRIEQSISTSIKDRDVLETESAIRIFERVSRWCKLAAEVLAIPLVILGGLGIWKASDLWSSVNRAKEVVTKSAESTKVQIAQISAASVSGIQAASSKAVSDNQSSAQTARKLSTEMQQAATHVRRQIQQESSSVQSQVASAQEQLKAIDKLQPEFGAMRGQLAKATSDLAEQQKAISNSEDFMRQVFSNHKLAIFSFESFQKNNSIVIPRSGASGNSVVYMLLPSAPLPGTLQLQYHIFLQPPTSFLNIHNLVVFFWGDAPDNLRQHAMTVSYFPDTEDKEVIKTLSLRDGRVFADDEPMPKFDQPDPDFKGNKWMHVNGNQVQIH